MGMERRVQEAGVGLGGQDGRVTVQSVKDGIRKTKVHLEVSLVRGCKERYKNLLPVHQLKENRPGTEQGRDSGIKGLLRG